MPKTTKNPYMVTASLESDGLWVIEVEDLPYGRTQTKRVEGIESMAREAIAIVEDVDVDDFDVSIDVKPPENVAEVLKRHKAINNQIRALTDELGEVERDALVGLVDAGWNVRSIALAMNMSPSTVSNRQRKNERSGTTK